MIAGALAALLVAGSARAQNGPTGNWSGTYSSSIQLSGCQNKTFTSSGNVSLTFLQNGAALVGRMDLTNVLVFNGNCTPTTQEVTRVILGTVDGNNLVWRFPNDSNGTEYNGTIGGDGITAQSSNVYGGTGTLSLTRNPATAPAADLTGSWTGSYAFTDQCSSGVSLPYSGALTLGLTQNGNDASGVVTMQNVPLYDQNCQKITTLNMSLTTAGVVSGTTFTGGVFDPAGTFEFPISATIGSGALTGNVTGANLTSTSGTFTLSRSSMAPPPADFAGSYDGTYSESDNDSLFCFNVAGLAFDGPASLSIVQSGDAISGSLVFENTLNVSSDGFGNCSVVNAGEQVLPLYGTLSGNTLTLTTLLGGGVTDLLSVTFNDGALTGTLTDSYGDYASFDAMRTANAAAPAVTSFQPATASIVAGQSTTLSWSTSNATSVSIDHGIGAQALSGSVTVSPAETTTYTLTAASPTGTATATATVSVYPPEPRRRAAHP